MGKQQNSLKSVLDNRPSMLKYVELDKKSRAFVDSIIKNGLKSNMVLRVGKKEVNPIKESFWSLKWRDLIHIRNLCESGDLYNVFEFVYNVNEKKFNSLDVFNCFACYKWINSQLKSISDLEKQELSHSFSQKELDAGVKELERFGHYPGLNTLTGGDITKEDEVLDMPYSKVFMKMCYNKVSHDIQMNLSK